LDTGEEEQNRHTGQGNGGAEEARKAPPLLKATSRKTGVGFDGKLKSGGGLERGQSNLGFQLEDKFPAKYKKWFKSCDLMLYDHFT
jgi:hypothetical protein